MTVGNLVQTAVQVTAYDIDSELRVMSCVYTFLIII